MKDVMFPESIWSVNLDGLSNPSACVQGHAMFQSGSCIEIDIPLGSLLKRTPVNGHLAYGRESLTANCVYGIDAKGYYQTVLDVHETHATRRFNGFESQTLHGHEMYRARCPIHPNPQVKSFTFGISGLREWVGASPINETLRFDAEDGTFDSIHIKLDSREIPTISLYATDDVTATIDYSWTSKGGSIPQFDYGLSTECSMTLSFHVAIALKDALERWVFPLRRFLGFCMGFYGSISSMQFETVDGVKAEYYAPLVEGEEPEPATLSRMPLTWKAIGKRAEGMLNVWFDLDGHAADAAIRAVALLSDWNMPIELEFLAVAQAFEAVTQVGATFLDLAKDEFRRRKRIVKESIEEDDVRDWVLEKIGQKNYRQANDLARDQLAKLGSFAKYVVADSERYLKEHRDTRNYYTHLGHEGKREVLHGVELVANRDATYLLLYASVCLLMGLGADEILELVKKSGFKSDSLYRARKRYGEFSR